MERITAHITDDRGIYLHSEEVDFYGPQPMNAVYVAPPEVADGLVARWAGGAWEVVERPVEVDPGPPPVLPSAVDVERDRRIDAGFEFEGVRYQSRPGDRENIAGAAVIALADPAYATGWIAADNSVVEMDAPTLLRFGRAAADHKQALIFAARQLKDMQPIPQDYGDDQWWPAA